MISFTQTLSNFGFFLFIIIQSFAFIGHFKKDIYKKNEQLPFVSFIIAAWNEEPRIKDCVNSILQQEYPKNKIEIIVIGGGTDNTKKVCRNLEKKRKIKFILEEKRMGKWYALNLGIKKSKGNVLAFVDGDCTLEKKWLTKMVNKAGVFDLVISYQIPKTERTYISKIYAIFTLYGYYLMRDLSKIFKVSTFFGYGGIVKRKIIKKIKFEKSLVEDLRFCIKAKEMGFKIGFISSATVFHSPAKTIRDFRNELLRGSYGIYSELIKKKDLISVIYVFLPFILIFNIPFLLLNIIVVDQFTMIFLTISFSILFFYILFCSLDRGTARFIFYIPHLFFWSIFLLFINIEAIFRIIFKKEFGWPIIQKISK